jgi:hypothetical protein
MIQLVYVSSATEPFSAEDLTVLLERSRRRNAASGITGMLLYRGGNFMQVLEGDEGVVRALFAAIGRDRRHSGVLTLLDGPIAGRQFPDWSMGFRNLADEAVRQLPGFSEFLNTPLTAQEFAGAPTRCQKLLQTFRRDMR